MCTASELSTTVSDLLELRRMRGGFLLHKTSVRGTDGKMHEKLYYIVHT